MVLKQNTQTLSQSPFRLMGGVVAQHRCVWTRTDQRNITAGQGLSDNLAGVPYGHRHPSAWLLPQSPGALSAFLETGVTVTPSSPTLIIGRGISGSTSATFSVGPSQLQLVVSASGSVTITFTLSAGAAAAVSASGSVSVAVTVGPSTLGAIIDAVGASSFAWTSSATIRAIGHLDGDVLPYLELSPENLALKVWQYALDSGLTAEQVVRVLASVAAGKSDITNLGGGAATVVFRDLADTKARVTATMAGSERTAVTIDAT